MTLRVLSAALVAGFFAACVASILQLALTSPLILEAEKYEKHAALEPETSPWPIVLAHAHEKAEAGASTKEDEWQPGAGLPRMAFTGLATLVTGVGYALLLGAALLACRREATPSEGFRFALGGFLAVSLAPAIGLPPELPGMEAGPLAARQAWWVATVLATGVGLYLAAIVRSRAAVVAGLALIVAPHLVGAPHQAEAGSALPATYAAQFAARSLAIAFVFWTVLGLSFGWAWQRVGGASEAALPARP
jgi:cobalt transporter subunit CbtA